MGSHACWVGAIVISIGTGRHFAAEWLGEFGGIGGLCDEVFSNGDNGPFGYGQNAAAVVAINGLLLAGAGVAAAVAIWSLFQRAFLLAVVNVVIGVVGGARVMLFVSAQVESNPYCPSAGWRFDGIVTMALLIAAAATNFVAGRWARRQVAGTTDLVLPERARE